MNLADVLSVLAMRLRNDKVSVFGWYEQCKGNEAAKLADRIETTLIMELAVKDTDQLESSLDDLSQLALLAGSTWAHHWEEPKETTTA